jgi:hypothetical protein
MKDRLERERRAEQDRRDEEERLRIIHFDQERAALERGGRKEPEEGPRNFLLGQNVYVEPHILAEREAKRRAHEEHQNCLRMQVRILHFGFKRLCLVCLVNSASL